MVVHNTQPLAPLEEAEPEGSLSLKTLVNPHQRQQEFLQAIPDYEYILYGGAAGGGKSYILRWALVGLLMKYAMEGHVGVRVVLFCEDYPALRDRHISKVKYEFPAWLGKLRQDPLPEFELAPRFGSGVLCFRNLDDPSKFLSAEFAAMAVDELTRNEEATFNAIRTRRRWPGIEHTPFLAATNPGQIGHAWVQRLWIQRDFPPELRSKAPKFKYIPARATDNPHLPASYIESLQSLPEKLRKAYLEGSWDTFDGQKFTEWRPEVHVVKPFPIPHWWRRWRSNDPGFTDPPAWYWYAVDPEGETVYVYREYTRRHSDQRINYSDQAKRVTELSHVGLELPNGRIETDEFGEPLKEKIDFTVTGMDAYTRHPETGKAIVDYYQLNGVSGLIQPIHGPGSRVQRASTVHEYLKVFEGKDGQITAKVKVFDTCEMLIATMPTLVADERYPEQVADSRDDHWYDSFSYGLSAHHSRQSVEPERPMTFTQKVWRHKDLLAKALIKRTRFND